MGNRFKGGIESGAMPFLHKYLGNPVLSGLGRLLFKSPVGDFHCGIRGFSKTAFVRMGLRDNRNGVCQRDGRQSESVGPFLCGSANRVFRQTDEVAHPIYARGAMGGGIYVFYCSTVHAGFFCIRG